MLDTIDTTRTFLTSDFQEETIRFGKEIVEGSSWR